MGLTMSDFGLLRKKNAIAEKFEGLLGQRRKKGRCRGGLHLPKSSMFALLSALDHLCMRAPTMFSRYEKTVECHSSRPLTKNEHKVNKRAGSAGRL